MNKSELIRTLSDKAKISIDEASLVVNTFIDQMHDALVKGNRIEIRGFGSFKVKEYEGYRGRNPKTGVMVDVPPKRMPFFRAGLELKNFVNE